MAQKKIRVEIPPEVSARVLFESDRICCVCRQKKPVQIHHIDENPANNDPANLAVLCFDCHRETQIRGGFDRKLNAGQVRLYRDDWLEHIRKYRMAGVPEWPSETRDSVADARIIAAKLEAAKAREDWCEVAKIYDEVDEFDLRDRYIDLARSQNPGPFYEFLFARMQGTVRDLPRSIIRAAMKEAGKDWPTHAVILVEAGRFVEAAEIYLKGIQKDLEQGNFFSAAFFMRHGLDDNIVDELFEIELNKSRKKGDLWWQVRALEELGRDDAKRDLLLANELRILASGDLMLVRELAEIKGDDALLLRTVKELSDAGIVANSRHDGPG